MGIDKESVGFHKIHLHIVADQKITAKLTYFDPLDHTNITYNQLSTGKIDDLSTLISYRTA